MTFCQYCLEKWAIILQRVKYLELYNVTQFWVGFIDSYKSAP